MSGADSKIKITTVTDPESIPDSWDQFVESSPEATIFHTREWQQVIGDTYRYEFRGLVATDENGKLVGVLPAFLISSILTGKRVVSSPFSYICGPLANSDEVTSILLASLRTEAEKLGVSYLEVKSLGSYPETAGLVESTNFTTYRIDLTSDEGTIFKNTHKGQIQRNIKKAGKEKIEVRVVNSENGVREFHRLNLITCRNHGIPAQPIEFHSAVLQSLSASSKADFLIAYDGDEAIAGVVTFTYGDTSVYMYGASDPRHLSLRPNHLLLWTAIKRAKSAGAKIFDLGRVSPDNTGLKVFKERWGGKAQPLYYYYWPSVKGVGSVDRTSLKFRLSNLVFSKLPIFITSRLTWLYKHLG